MNLVWTITKKTYVQKMLIHAYVNHTSILFKVYIYIYTNLNMDMKNILRTSENI